MIKENLETLKNRTLDEVMASIRLPTDQNSLQLWQKYINRIKGRLRKPSQKIEKLKKRLDEKVAEIYGIGDEINVIRNALKVISGEIVIK